MFERVRCSGPRRRGEMETVRGRLAGLFECDNAWLMQRLKITLRSSPGRVVRLGDEDDLVREAILSGVLNSKEVWEVMNVLVEMEGGKASI
jgi:hypothetical protein